MAYPSNDSTGVKNLVDFVLHLRDSEDSLKQTIADAEIDIDGTIADAKKSIATSVSAADGSANAAKASEQAAANTLSAAEAAIEAKKNACLSQIPDTYTNLSRAVETLQSDAARDRAEFQSTGLVVVDGRLCVTVEV